MFPIYVLKRGVELPEQGTYYIITGDGIFLHKDTGFIQATVKVDKISFLEALEPSMALRLPKISSEIIVKSLLFFRRIYQYHRAEAVVLLHYSQEKNYLPHCPKQRVDKISVDYDLSERFEGYQLIGTIHSHCDFSAFHSPIDEGNEEDFDGIHITIGNVDLPYFTISCSIVVNNNRFKVKPKDIIEGIREIDYTPPFRLFRPNYRRRKVPRRQGDIAKVGSKPDEVQFYEIVLPDDQDYRSYPSSRDWFGKVKKRRKCLFR